MFNDLNNESNISSQTLDLKKFFSVNTNVASKINQHTPSTFMRRSFDLDQLHTKSGELRARSFWGQLKEIYRMDIENVRTICNYDAYIYAYYLRMSSIFFAIMSCVNLV